MFNVDSSCAIITDGFSIKNHLPKDTGYSMANGMDCNVYEEEFQVNIITWTQYWERIFSQGCE